jgi:hypothetical protein
MAYLIECDRCGNTESVKGSLAIEPSGWLQFNDLHFNSNPRSQKVVQGGVFCPGCARSLAEWRQPLPRAMSPEDMRRSV